MKANLTIRDLAKRKNVKLWEIAQFLGISEPTITRWLRISLTPEKEKTIIDAINAIAKEAS